MSGLSTFSLFPFDTSYHQNHQLIISFHPRQGSFGFKQPPPPDMQTPFRNTGKDCPHRGLAETCLLHFARCLAALPNTAQPSARRDLWDRGEDGAGQSVGQHNPHPPASSCIPPHPPASPCCSSPAQLHGSSTAVARAGLPLSDLRCSAVDSPG